MIHVCYAFTDKNGSYSKFVGTSIQSLFENSCEGICVHLIHDSTLTEDNRKKFLQLPINGNQMILFYNLETLKPDIIEYLTKRTTDDNQKRFTFGMYYRFMMPDVIPPEISKAIYLDGDTVVNIDIKTLWDIDLKDCPLGAAAEVEMGVGIEKQSLVTHKNFPSVKKGWIKAENYFNSGIMSFNLDALRRFKAQNSENGKSFLESIMEYCEKRFNKNMSDQAILNCTFSDHYIHIPPIYNKPVDFYCERKYPLSPGICHFISYKKNLGINSNDQYNRLFLKYFLRTPWGISSPEISFNLYKNSMQNLIKRCQSMLRINYLEKILFVFEKDLPNLQKKLPAGNYRVMPANNVNAIQVAMNLMKGSNRVCLIDDNLYADSIKTLESNGFHEFEDFLSISKYLELATLDITKIEPILTSKEFLQKL